MSLPNEPISRKETYLAKIAGQDVPLPASPISREEQYLDYIAKHGGGGGGVTDYDDLFDRPQINSVTLTGNKSASDLGLVSTSETEGLLKNDGTVDTNNYATKVSNATNGHLASLDASGNLHDGGWNLSTWTVTATTSSTGLIDTGLSEDYRLLSIIPPNNVYVNFVFRTTNKGWRVVLYDATTGRVLADTQVTLDIIYIE